MPRASGPSLEAGSPLPLGDLVALKAPPMSRHCQQKFLNCPGLGGSVWYRGRRRDHSDVIHVEGAFWRDPRDWKHGSGA